MSRFTKLRNLRREVYHVYSSGHSKCKRNCLLLVDIEVSLKISKYDHHYVSVTGSNKGIGFAIVRSLCRKFDGDVYLTSRDESRGKQAVSELEKEGLKPLYHQLDICNAESRDTLAKFIKEKYGGLDVLVNNAGIAYKRNSTAPFAEQAEVTVETNCLATLAFCQKMLPLLRPGARVVNVSSMASISALNNSSAELSTKLKSLSTTEDLTTYMKKFIEDVKAGSHTEAGWPQTAYGVSKIGVTLMTPILQKQLEEDETRPDIVINSCCPGYVATDMSSYKGTKTIDEGADTPVYLALLPPNTDIKGEYVSERKVQKYK
ncbi:hypothetical protein LSH36_184g10015 [Paralvinella palmiformis]|uniref:carbonyl reductase (NADPH) n=1 Tax=Paralvinella palmiformis TaxID=53620 RepID=A0AAD9N5H8_9ANNE|nr:hypothetical protein LSH36_184g10015 [Paralvinella palmiformis]